VSYCKEREKKGRRRESKLETIKDMKKAIYIYEKDKSGDKK
jgi:hypothetical protein